MGEIVLGHHFNLQSAHNFAKRRTQKREDRCTAEKNGSRQGSSRLAKLSKIVPWAQIERRRYVCVTHIATPVMSYR